VAPICVDSARRVCGLPCGRAAARTRCCSPDFARWLIGWALISGGCTRLPAPSAGARDRGRAEVRGGLDGLRHRRLQAPRALGDHGRAGRPAGPTPRDQPRPPALVHLLTPASPHPPTPHPQPSWVCCVGYAMRWPSCCGRWPVAMAADDLSACLSDSSPAATGCRRLRGKQPQRPAGRRYLPCRPAYLIYLSRCIPPRCTQRIASRPASTDGACVRE
jgi:hypothetical protein